MVTLVRAIVNTFSSPPFLQPLLFLDDHATSSWHVTGSKYKYKQSKNSSNQVLVQRGLLAFDTISIQRLCPLCAAATAAGDSTGSLYKTTGQTLPTLTSPYWTIVSRAIASSEQTLAYLGSTLAASHLLSAHLIDGQNAQDCWCN